MEKQAFHLEFKLPQMGEGVFEATIVRWLKNIGEPVKKNEPLLEVSTDKVDTEIVCPADGYLVAIFAEIGETVALQETIAQISDSADAKVQTKSSQRPKTSKQTNENSNTRETNKDFSHTVRSPSSHLLRQDHLPTSFAGATRSSPLVKKIAKDYGLNLYEVKGSGLYGRITQGDVYAYLDAHQSPQSSAPTIQDKALSTKVVDGKEYLDGVQVRREKMSPIRRLTAEHMLKSVQISPHVTTTFEVDLARVVAYRNAKGEQFLSQHGFKLTYTPFFIFAAISALKEHPQVNCSVDGDEILHKDSINVGCAVALTTGLIVPVIKEARSMNLIEVATSLHDLVTRAHNKQLSPQDIKGGTFSITNPGMYGSLHSQPIINQPQVAIMSVGAIIERPVVFQGKIVVHPLCQIGLTFDHRVIDGEGGAKFLATVKNALESF